MTQMGLCSRHPIRTSLRHCRSPFPGNGILRRRDSDVKKARHIQPIVSRDKARQENPPIRRYLRDAGKSLFVLDCVVGPRGLELPTKRLLPRDAQQRVAAISAGKLSGCLGLNFHWMSPDIDFADCVRHTLQPAGTETDDEQIPRISPRSMTHVHAAFRHEAAIWPLSKIH